MHLLSPEVNRFGKRTIEIFTNFAIYYSATHFVLLFYPTLLQKKLLFFRDKSIICLPGLIALANERLQSLPIQQFIIQPFVPHIYSIVPFAKKKKSNRFHDKSKTPVSTLRLNVDKILHSHQEFAVVSIARDSCNYVYRIQQ